MLQQQGRGRRVLLRRVAGLQGCVQDLEAVNVHRSCRLVGQVRRLEVRTEVQLRNSVWRHGEVHLGRAPNALVAHEAAVQWVVDVVCLGHVRHEVGGRAEPVAAGEEQLPPGRQVVGAHDVSRVRRQGQGVAVHAHSRGVLGAAGRNREAALRSLRRVHPRAGAAVGGHAGPAQHDQGQRLRGRVCLGNGPAGGLAGPHGLGHAGRAHRAGQRGLRPAAVQRRELHRRVHDGRGRLGRSLLRSAHSHRRPRRSHAVVHGPCQAARSASAARPAWAC